MYSESKYRESESVGRPTPSSAIRAADFQRVEFACEGEVQRDDRRGVGGANWHGRDLARGIHQDVPRGRARPVGAAVQFEERLARTGRFAPGLGGGEHPHRTSLGEINFGCSALTKILPSISHSSASIVQLSGQLRAALRHIWNRHGTETHTARKRHGNGTETARKRHGNGTHRGSCGAA